jgi:pyrrolidone-carboxylate peptidase
MLVTGFGPFGEFTENPSSGLAGRLSQNSITLRVTYLEVDRFVRSVRERSDSVILCLGLNAKLTAPSFELYAHNKIGERPGVDGKGAGRTVILKSRPQTIGQTLATPAQLPCLPMNVSFSPGDYLCNYLLFSLLARYSDRRIGFIHVPPFAVMPEDEQAAQLLALVEHLELA